MDGGGATRAAIIADRAESTVLHLALSRAWRGDAVILGPMEIAVAPGETVALTGPSGVGKTTLLRIMAGLDERFEGTRSVAVPIGMVFQEPVLLPWRSAARNLTLTCGIGRAEADAALASVGLGGMGAHFPGQMSLGQQRRLALARAFGSGAGLLLMDEPFVSLDPETADGVMEVYERLRDRHRVSTVLVTHDASEATRLADRTLRLAGRPAELLPG